MRGRADGGIVGPIPPGPFLPKGGFALGIALRPLLYPSTQLQDKAWVDLRGGTVDSLQVILTTYNFHHLYLLSSDQQI